MSKLAQTISQDLAEYFRMVHQQVHRWVDPLSDEQMWRRPFEHGNTVAHLVLHITGNLNYYIGARAAGTGYVRDREREFTEKNRMPKQEVLTAFDRAINMVIETAHSQSEADWMRPYSAERAPEAKERFNIFLRCAGHAYHHVGQLVYQSRELTK